MRRPTSSTRLRYEGGLANYQSVLLAEDAVLQARVIVADLDARAFHARLASWCRPWAAATSRADTRLLFLGSFHVQLQHPLANSPVKLLRQRACGGASRRGCAGRSCSDCRRQSAGGEAQASLHDSRCGHRRRDSRHADVVFGLTAGQVTTDNAYVDADVAPSDTFNMAARSPRRTASNTDVVKKGQLLVVPRQRRRQTCACGGAGAAGQVQRKVQGYFANDAALGGQVNSRDADIAHAAAQLASAQADFTRARVELSRRQALSASGSGVGR